MQKITPFLWFDGQAEEAAEFYVSLFPNSSVDAVSRYGGAGPGKPGSAMTVSFQLDGRPFLALNGGPHYRFTPAVSFIRNCETQEEVDSLWHRLLDGGTPQQCGWITDRFGVSWQIVPNALMELLSGPDAAAGQRVMKAMLGMVKLDIAGLRAAAAAH